MYTYIIGERERKYRKKGRGRASKTIKKRDLITRSN
jgi:hypothetical protein